MPSSPATNHDEAPTDGETLVASAEPRATPAGLMTVLEDDLEGLDETAKAVILDSVEAIRLGIGKPASREQALHAVLRACAVAAKLSDEATKNVLSSTRRMHGVQKTRKNVAPTR